MTVVALLIIIQNVYVPQENTHLASMFFTMKTFLFILRLNQKIVLVCWEAMQGILNHAFSQVYGVKDYLTHIF